MANLKFFNPNHYIILNILFSLIPLSYIIGNFAINFNVFLLIVYSLIIFNKKIFKIKLLFLDKIILGFFILAIFSAIINTIESMSAEHDNSTLIKTILFFRYLLLYFVLRYLIENEKIYFKWFFISSLCCTLFVSFDIFYQFAFSQDIFGLKPLHPSKLSGPFGDELIAGGFIHKFSLFGIFVLPFFKFKKNYLSLILSILFLIYMTAIMLSGNRMPLVLFLLSIFLILLFEKKTRKYIPISLIVVSCVFYVIYKNNPIVKNSFDSFLDNSTDMINVFVVENITKSSKIPEKKIPVYYQELKTFYGTWMMNKYIGGGIKSFRHNCPKRKILSHNERTTCNMHPHNYYLEILTDTGIMGLLISCLIFIITIYNSLIKNYFLKPTKAIDIISVPFIFVFISEIFPLRVSGSFFTTSTSTFIFILIAVIITRSKKKIRD
tara:strand:+ start:1746 stop:3053 length:1308 start_codon:yes stop_codon:yes gene_type:complete